jgi:hypothetical protein
MTTTTSLDNIQFMNSSNIKAEDLDGDIPIKPTDKPKMVDVALDINNQQNNPISTLDEPVSVTITRDLKAVGYKFAHVFFPKRSTLLLKDWDLWGPLFLSVLLAVTLQGDTKKNDGAPQFANMFALIAIGAVIVTINAKLLAGKINFFQSICVLGYCLLPLVLVSLISNIVIRIIDFKTVTLFTLRCVLVFFAYAWSVFASIAFLAADTINLGERKALAVYPILLFYFIISWLIILNTN